MTGGWSLLVRLLGFDGYWVAEDGAVWTDRTVELSRVTPYCYRGDVVVRLWTEDGTITISVLRCLAYCFLPPAPTSSHVARPINGDPADLRWDNVQWAERSSCASQARDARARVLARGKTVTANGQTKTTEEWAAATGINGSTLRGRIRSGWDPAEAVTLPADSKAPGGQRTLRETRAQGLTARKYQARGQCYCRSCAKLRSDVKPRTNGERIARLIAEVKARRQAGLAEPEFDR